MDLSLDEYRRYGRQLILDGFGLQGQLALKQSSAVVVGAGGLGCPALQYLAATGVGRIGVIDNDIVELSNLQRQILHSESRIGQSKAASAAQAIKQINSNIQIDVHNTSLSTSNAVTLLNPYDIILDCTDNPSTRYLLSDVSVLLKKPLVSGAAQKFEGQLCVYNLGDQAPCYRCLFPKPPEPEFTAGCQETGILGAVTGVIGNLQALEAVKIITGMHDGKPTMLLFSCLSPTPFRTIKIRSRKPDCAACGVNGLKALDIQNMDYVSFCGGPRPDWEQRGSVVGKSRIKPKELWDMINSGTDVRIIDVRSSVEFAICHLPGSINIPLSTLLANPAECFSGVESTCVAVCRLGNDSQMAVDALRTVENSRDGLDIKDLIGGLVAWSTTVDNQFPIY